MAVNRVPVLKRCRSLGLDPVYIGIDKKSNRNLKRANRSACPPGAAPAGHDVAPAQTSSDISVN